MECLDRFNLKMDLSGGSLREENILNSKMLLDETFSDDSSFIKGIYFWKLNLKSYDDEIPIKIRFYKRTFSQANGILIKFQTLIDTPVEIGDILYDSIADEYYICTESFNINDIHWQGKLTYCNWILKWQDESGKILEYPCNDINSTQYNSGETSNRQFTIGTSQHMILLPCDENTVKLDSPQRFFLDRNMVNPTSFIVTQNDTTSYNFGKKGIIRLTVYEYVGDTDKDRIDLEICDYKEINDINTDIDDENMDDTDIKSIKAVILYDSKVIKSGGSNKKFIGKFFDDKNEVTDITPKWDVICDFKNNLDITIQDDWISIGIDDDNYIDDNFKLRLSDKDDRYFSTLIISIESLL